MQRGLGWVVGGGLVLALIGGVIMVSRRSPSSAGSTDQPAATQSAPSSQTMIDTAPSPSSSVSTPSVTASQYVDYDAQLVASTAGTKLLFFYAPWCPQCRALEASIKAGTIPPGVTIFKTDYDSHQALRKQYGVTIQTTLVRLDDQGNKVDAYVAYDEPTLTAVVAAFGLQ